MLDLERWQDDGVIISLLLTRRCNFECEHCMYECGPYFRGYMSDDVLWAVYEQIGRLQDLEIYPSINLVGGEPTLNLKKFEHILDIVMDWNVQVEMTTNGWWLHKAGTARKFFNAVAPYVEYDGTGEGFSVRISDDQFHDKARPFWLKDGKMKHRLSSVWEYSDDEILYKVRYYCGNCDRYFHQWPDGERCPKCREYVDITDEYMLDRTLPQPHEGHPWIYVDPRTNGSHWVIPTGRANHWGINDLGCNRGYSNANGLSYLPNGQLMDICCKGSWCEFGTVDDDPLLLLELGRIFTEQEKPSCQECRELAKMWKRTKMRRVKAQLEKEIAECTL